MSVVSCFENGLDVLHLPFNNTSDLFVGKSNNTIWFVYKRVVREGDKDKWHTDEDEFGAARVRVKDQKFTSIETFPLPIRLKEKETGANGAKRRILSTVRFDGKLICTLEEPFSETSAEGYSWGSRNFIFAFEIKEKKWRLGVIDKTKGSIKHYPPLAVQLDEIPVEWAACGGEGRLVLDQDGPKLVTDSTPYHLDDWVKTTNANKVVKKPVSKSRILVDEKRMLVNYFDAKDEKAKLTSEAEIEKSEVPPFIRVYAPGYKKMIWTIRYPVSFLLDQDKSFEERSRSLLGWDLEKKKLDSILALDPNLSKFTRTPWVWGLSRFYVSFVGAVYLDTPEGLLLVLQASRPASEHWLMLIRLGDGEVHQCDSGSQNCISFCPPGG